MEMHQIRYAVAVYRTRNFTRAARTCGVAQPSLTKAIKALERELGGRLFHRDHTGVQLTGLGARLWCRFESLAQLAAQIETEAAEYARSGPVPIASSLHRPADRSHGAHLPDRDRQQAAKAAEQQGLPPTAEQGGG